MTFPPEPHHEDDIEKLLEVFASVAEGREAVYVSSPLTTGRLRSEWHRSRDTSDEEDSRDPEELRRHVLDPNRANARRFVRDLRQHLGRVVIDPLGLKDIPGWTQDDYRAFWSRVIEHYAGSVVFRAGWEYSSGCSFEFLAAVQGGAELLDENLKPLPVEEGRRLLQAAIQDNRSQGHPTSFLESVLAALNDHAVGANVSLGSAKPAGSAVDG